MYFIIYDLQSTAVASSPALSIGLRVAFSPFVIPSDSSNILFLWINRLVESKDDTQGSRWQEYVLRKLLGALEFSR